MPAAVYFDAGAGVDFDVFAAKASSPRFAPGLVFEAMVTVDNRGPLRE